LVELESPKEFARIAFAAGPLLVILLSRPHFIPHMDEKSTPATNGIKNALGSAWRQHLHPQVNDIAWREELSVLSLGHCRDEVLERIIHNAHICAEETNPLERPDAYLQVVWRQSD